MESHKKNLALFVPVFLFVAAIILVYNPEEVTTKAILFYTNNISAHSKTPWIERDELEIALEKASTEKKTVIIAMINKAYVEADEEYKRPSMLDLFLEGFWVGEGTRPLLRHLLVVSMDTSAHERCQFRRLNCYLMGGDSFAGEKVYMSGEFIEMMWRRIAFLLQLLNRGYNLIFTDTDVIWLRDPFTRLAKNDSIDLEISTDHFSGDPFSKKNPINTGFYWIRSSIRTRSLFQKWYDTRTNATGMKEQDVLQMLIRDKAALTEFNVTAKFLDTQYFSGFCSDSQNVGAVITVHANCCRTIKAKIVDLKAVLMDWKRRNVSINGHFRWSPHTACRNSWNN